LPREVIPTSPALSAWMLLGGVAHSSARSSALWRGPRGGEAGPEHPAWALTRSPGTRALLSPADPPLCQGTVLVASGWEPWRMDVYPSPGVTCAVSALAPCLHSPLAQGVG